MKITGKRGELRARHIISGGGGGSERIKGDGESEEGGGMERDYRVYSYYVMSKSTHPSYTR